MKFQPFLRADIDPEYQGSEFAEVLGGGRDEGAGDVGGSIYGEQKSSEKIYTSNFGKHPRKLTWNPKNEGLEYDFPFKTVYFQVPC